MKRMKQKREEKIQNTHIAKNGNKWATEMNKEKKNGSKTEKMQKYVDVPISGGESKEKSKNLAENPFKMSDTRRTDDYIVYDEWHRAMMWSNKLHQISAT